MTSDLLLRNGTIVTPEGLFEGNVYAEGGKISAITRWDVVWEARRTEDVSGKLIFPGAIDVHVHFNDPGYAWREDFGRGTLAAAAGGVTTVIDMPLQNEPALTSAPLFRAKHAAVRDKAVVDYAFWGGLVNDVPDQMEELHNAGAAAFKIFIGPVSPDYRSLDMGAVRETLRRASSLDALVGFHAEDYSIIKHEEARAEEEGRRGRPDFIRSRPLSAELIAIQNVIELVRETGARAHI
jgi:allantoinase